MQNKDLNTFSKNENNKSFIVFIKLLMVLGVISKFLWWIPLCWSIVSFFKLEFSQGILPLVASLVMLIIWRSKEKLKKSLETKE